MSGCACDGSDDLDASNAEQRRLLWILLAINGGKFIVEAISGWLADSTGLLAGALDTLADSTVYIIGLWAVGHSLKRKRVAARWSGAFQVTLALWIAFEVLHRWWLGSEPEGEWMMGVGLLALLANFACMALLTRHRQGEVHMRASWIFSVNDVLANLGVILSGALVTALGSRIPDLVIGAIITALVLRGGIVILREAGRAEPVEPLKAGVRDNVLKTEGHRS